MTTATKPAKKKVTKKTASKSPSVKKHPKGKGTGTKKKTTKVSKNGKAEYGTERSNDLPWNNKKVSIFVALKQLKAISGAMSAVSAKAVAAKATDGKVKISTRDVRHYCYHAKVSGLVGLAEVEDIRGYGFFLTAKGVGLNPTGERKEQDASKK